MADPRKNDPFGPGAGYTLASGNLYCDFSEFHRFAEHVMSRPVWTHEFGNPGLWDEMRKRFEASVIEESDA